MISVFLYLLFFVGIRVYSQYSAKYIASPMWIPKCVQTDMNPERRLFLLAELA